MDHATNLVRINDRDEFELTQTVTRVTIFGLEIDASLDDLLGLDSIAWRLSARQTIKVIHQRFSPDGKLLDYIKEDRNKRIAKLPENVGEWFSLSLSEGDPETTGTCRAHDSLFLDNGDTIVSSRHCNAAEGFGVNKVSLYR